MAFAELVDDQIIIQTEWSEKDLIKRVPGTRWNPKERVWTAPLSWGTCQALRGEFGSNLGVGTELSKWSWYEHDQRVGPATQLREALTTENHYEPSRNGYKLYDFQRAGADWMIHAQGGLLGDEMGTGKTVQVLSALRKLHTNSVEPVLPALVVCPNSTKIHWADHVDEWFPEATPYPLLGTAAVRRKTLTEAADDPTAFIIANIESIRLMSRLAPYGSIKLKRCRECDPAHGDEDLTPARCEVHIKPLNDIDLRTCIIDEAHRVKDPKAKQTRAIWAVFHGLTVSRRYAMTGTPIANHPGDLWSTMHAVAPADFPNKSKYMDRYAMLSWNAFGGMDVSGLRHDTKDEFFRILDPRFRRVTKGLVLPQLPSKVRISHVVDMTPKQARAYKDLSERLVTRLDDGQVLVARSNLSAQIRLLQLASSYCEINLGDDPDDPAGWTVTPSEPSPKVDALVELMQDVEGPVAIAAEHRKLLELASARLTRLRVDHAMITGGVPEVERADQLKRFQDGKLDVIMFTFKAGGVGLNMTRAGTLIRLQRSWSLVDNKQGEDRVHRIGSEIHDSVNIIDVIARGTVEESQLHRLRQKLERLEEITRDKARLQAAGLSVDSLELEEVDVLGSYLGEG